MRNQPGEHCSNEENNGGAVALTNTRSKQCESEKGKNRSTDLKNELLLQLSAAFKSL